VSAAAGKRAPRDERRRSLGQNLLRPDLAGQLVAAAAFVPGDLVVEIGAGRGVCTFALAGHGVDVVALERDPRWAASLRREVALRDLEDRVRVVCCDARDYRMPRRPFRAFGSLPFGATTSILRHLLDPSSTLVQADLIVQLEVARKRAATPPTTLLSTTWAPWWSFEMGRRIRASAFRPVPAVDAAVLRVVRRVPPLLPVRMADAYASFVQREWK
jgi:23S rRNA (adenine-N6)-dimethyltransferase